MRGGVFKSVASKPACYKHFAPLKNSEKALAFTLAEVLITLSIIGIIAAITIPSIIANHQRRTLETQFAKVYRTLMQAVSLAVAEHGDMSGWDWKNEYTSQEKDDFVKKFFVPYLNVVKFCPADGSNKGCFADVQYRYLNGELWNNDIANALSAILLADGTSIRFKHENRRYENEFIITVDVNGYKKPNILGADVFSWSLYPQLNEIHPFATYVYNSQTGEFTYYSDEGVLSSCNEASQGWSCSARVVREGFKINYDW